MRQCEAIRQLVRKHGLNRDYVVTALAAGLAQGRIRWERNTHGLTPLQYAGDLYNNYVGRGRL
jgi:hypothetical protein